MPTEPKARIGIHAWYPHVDWAVTDEPTPGDDREWPMSHVLLKTHESVYPMSRYVPSSQVHAADIDGPAKFRWLADEIFAPQDITLLGWNVARGINKAYAEQEGALSGLFARESGGLSILDLETRDEAGNYWHPFPNGPRIYLEAAKAQGVSKFWVNPDWRRGHEDATQMAEWLDAVQELGLWGDFRTLPQCYPEIFYPRYGPGRDRARRSIDNVLYNLDRYAVPHDKIMPCFSLAADPKDWEEGLIYMDELGLGGVTGWRRGIAREDTRRFIGELNLDDLPGQPDWLPPTEPPVEPPKPPEPGRPPLSDNELTVLQFIRRGLKAVSAEQTQAADTSQNLGKALAQLLLERGVPEE